MIWTDETEEQSYWSAYNPDEPLALSWGQIAALDALALLLIVVWCALVVRLTRARRARR
jgi:hypothetical protein